MLGSYATESFLKGLFRIYFLRNPHVDFPDLPPGRYAIEAGIEKSRKAPAKFERRTVVLREGQLLTFDWKKGR